MFTKNNISNFGLIFGIFLFSIFFYTSPPKDLEYVAWVTAGVAVLMTVWWITEAVPIYATGLVPLVLFPILGLP